MVQSELLSIRIFLVKFTLKTGREIYYYIVLIIINSVLETNTWTYKIKDLNGEKVIKSFYEKELLRSNL